jgi:hypothetical protein
VTAFERAAIVAAGTSVTFATLDPAAFRPASEVPQPMVSLPVLLHLDRVMSGLSELRSRVQFPGVALGEAEFGADGRSVTLTAWSVRELSNWYDALRDRCQAGVSSRQERRADGQLYGLGGMEWELCLGEVVPGVRVYVESESGEFEVLPDTALVRALCPWMAARRAAAGQAVAA